MGVFMEGKIEKQEAAETAPVNAAADTKAAPSKKKRRRRKKSAAAKAAAQKAAAETAQEPAAGPAPALPEQDAPQAESEPPAAAPAGEEPPETEEAKKETIEETKEERPAPETAAQTPAEDAPAEEKPAEETPAEETPAEEAPAEQAEPALTPEQLRRNAEMTRTVQISIEKILQMQQEVQESAAPAQEGEAPAAEPPAPAPAPTLEQRLRSQAPRVLRWLLLVAAFVVVVSGIGIGWLYSGATADGIPEIEVAFNGATVEAATSRWKVPVVGDLFKRTYAEKGPQEPVEMPTVEEARAELRIRAEDCETELLVTDAEGETVFEGTAEAFDSYRFEQNGDYSAELRVYRDRGKFNDVIITGQDVYRFRFSVHLRPNVRINASTVRQGGVVALRVTGLLGEDAPELVTELPNTGFYEGESGWIAYVPVGCEQEAGEYILRVEADGYTQEIALIVMQRIEQERDVYSQSQLTSPYIGYEDTPDEVEAALRRTAELPAWDDEGFVQPFTTTLNVSLGYGVTEYVGRTSAQRRNGGGTGRTSTNAVLSSQYNGQLIAPAAGRVLLAEELDGAAGNTLVIDHGAGVVSIFYGLRSLDVEAGDTVARGRQLATTNQVTIGEVRVAGVPVEPLAVWRNQCDALRYR